MKKIFFVAAFAFFNFGCTTPYEATNLQSKPVENNPEQQIDSPQDSTTTTSTTVTTTTIPNQTLLEEFATWKKHYKTSNPLAKLTDNRGAGYEDLYGTRNFRVVLHGVYYRGGGNNKYLKPTPRENENPLPAIGLKNLCEEGFGQSIYYYSKNFDSNQAITNCNGNELRYRQISGFVDSNEKKLMETIFNRIKGKISGPIYGHCWNGWHASGFIAAKALRQFCDWTADQAINYWVKGTDGDSDYPTIKTRIANFKTHSEFKITMAEKEAICPAIP